MFKTKQLTEAALFCSIASILQLIPVFLSEVFVLFTMLSSIPIYLITRKIPKLGVISYLATSIIIWFINSHEAVIFIFLNGIVGLGLGILTNVLKQKYLIYTITGSTLTLSIIFVNFVIGIPVFGSPIQLTIIIFLGIITFSIVYSCFYLYFLDFLIKRVTLFKNYIKKSK